MFLFFSSRRVNTIATVLIGGGCYGCYKAYDEDLRAIGQALEARDISNFELKRLTDTYIISGMPEQTRSVSFKGTAVAAAIA